MITDIFQCQNFKIVSVIVSFSPVLVVNEDLLAQRPKILLKS